LETSTPGSKLVKQATLLKRFNNIPLTKMLMKRAELFEV